MELPPYQLQEQTRDQVVLRLTLDEQLPCFRGHFDGLPVLAGVTQIGWALALAQRYFGRSLHFRAMRSTKFQQLVRPPCSLSLTLQLSSDGERLRFRYTGVRGTCSSGNVLVKNVLVKTVSESHD
ncbi:hypothetical protein [Marinimicrobium sp. ARAG 43.8]|uniref:ApeI family dehydratase n=1 Tax=Marinimicrobium sp. ARAG 43.8 TaxID=3418719 RepID=UPI003CFB6469